MNIGHCFFAGCPGKAEDGAVSRVEPVREELDVELGSLFQVAHVGGGHVFGCRSRDVVSIHVEGHAAPEVKRTSIVS